MSIYDHTRHLHEEGLYSNIIHLLRLVLPQIKSTPDAITVYQEYHIYIFFGDAYYYENNYRNAEKYYQMALDLRKSAAKNKKKNQNNWLSEVNSEIDVKFKLHICYKKLNQHLNATLILESISAKQRTARINVSLGELYQREKKEALAIQCYREVLKECPLSLEIILNLIKLGVKQNDLVNIVINSSTNMANLNWLPIWIKAHSYLCSPDMTQAITLFKQLLSSNHFQNNPEIMRSLGQALYYNGDYKRAISTFKNTFTIDPLSLNGLDLYASCLAKENQVKELEYLANKMIAKCADDKKYPEPWITLAYYCYLTEKQDYKKDSKDFKDQKVNKAMNFATKACSLNGNSAEAFILRGLIELKANSDRNNERNERNNSRKEILKDDPFKDVRKYFKEALDIAPFHFEALKGLTDAHLAENKKSQASSVVSNAFKLFGQNPRTLTLYATVLLSDSEKGSNKKNAKTHLEKAVKHDPGYLPAVYLLVQLYNEEKNVDKAIEVLNHAIEEESNEKLHRMLGDCYNEKNEQDKALHHHNIASKLERNYGTNTSTSQRLEHPSCRSSNPETSMELEVDDEPQESENEIDESETDVVWSDADF